MADDLQHCDSTTKLRHDESNVTIGDVSLGGRTPTDLSTNDNHSNSIARNQMAVSNTLTESTGSNVGRPLIDVSADEGNVMMDSVSGSDAGNEHPAALEEVDDDVAGGEDGKNKYKVSRKLDIEDEVSSPAAAEDKVPRTFDSLSLEDVFVKEERPVTARNVVIGLGVLLLGIVEGIGFSTSGVTAPVAMREQMVFNVWIVMKMFFGALGASMLSQALYSVVRAEQFRTSRASLHTTTTWKRAVGGCFVLGIGMSLSGAGISILPAQIGARVLHGPITFAGLFIGTLLYALAEYLYGSTGQSCPKPTQVVTADQWLKVTYWKLAVPGGLALLAAASVLEVVIPQSEDGKRLGVGPSPPLLPIFVGLLIGFSQIPMRLATGEGRGGSSSVMAFVHFISCGRLAAAHRTRSLTEWYPIIHTYLGSCIGGLIGGYVQPDYHAPRGYDWWYCVIGGILMGFGARTAHGCTCGHGISGTSELSFQSMAATAAIFGGAICTGFVLYSAGEVSLEYA